MTHTPHNPLILLAQVAFILLMVSGLPTAFVVQRVYSYDEAVGKGLFALIAPVWIITWVRATQVSVRHATLQREAARAHDCLGYAEGAMPQRCTEVMVGPGVTPDGFFVWMGGALAFAIVGILLMLGEEFVEKYVDFSNVTLEESGWFWFIDRRPAKLSVTAWICLGLLGPAFIVFELWSFVQIDAKISVPLLGLQATLAVGWLLFCLYRATRRGVVGVREQRSVIQS